MCQLDRLRQLKPEIDRIARRHHAGKVYVFGSCARREEIPGSDVDFIAEFTTQATLFDQCGLKVDLEELLQCKVDVISKRVLKNDAFGKNVQRDMVEIC